MGPILSIENVSGGYHKDAVIHGVTLSVSKGEFLGIIGPNGSGKTTLLRLASRILSSFSGSIRFDGQDIYSMQLKDFCSRTAFVQQDTAIHFPFTVFEIVLMGRIPHLKRLQSETKADIDCALNALVLTDTLHLKDTLIDELSSGERQRVLIAKALAQEPELLFLDEPTSHLDIGHQIQILDLLRDLNKKQNLTIIMVLHDLNLVGEYCSRVALFENGAVFKEGSVQEVLTYNTIEAVYKTVVVVEENPISKKPYVILVSGERIHVH